MSAHDRLDVPVSFAPHETLARDLIRERTIGRTRSGLADVRRGSDPRTVRAARRPRAASLLRRWADRLDPRPVDEVVHRVEREPRPWAPVRRPAAHRHS